MHWIEYGDITLHGNAAQNGRDRLLISGQCIQSVSLFGSRLQADSLCFRVVSCALEGGSAALIADSDGKLLKDSDGNYLAISTGYTDLEHVAPGTPLVLHSTRTNAKLGTFYAQTVKRVNRNSLEFTCTDGVGALAMMEPHAGGIYSAAQAGTVIAEIFSGSGVLYTVASDVSQVLLNGHLPRADRRENLNAILIATGATLYERNGILRIAFLAEKNKTALSKQIYLDSGSVISKTPATSVQVTEHAYYARQSDQAVTLFDNTAEVEDANSQLVVFDEPCHDLACTGTLTISSSSCNHAVVSGKGTLTGQEYTHTRRVITKSTGETGSAKIAALEDNGLVGYHNSDYVATRLVRYYKLRENVKFEYLDRQDDILPASWLAFEDQYGKKRSGWLEEKSFALGNKTRAAMTIQTGWQPGPFGNRVDSYVLFAEPGEHTWTVPAGVTRIRLALGAGGDGGNGGTAGTDGSDGDLSDTEPTPGTGGTAGTAGSAGKILAPSQEYQVSPGDVLTITVGAGGSAGAKNGGTGTAGKNTTIAIPGIGTISSNAGSVQTDGWLNLFTGEVYGLAARDGFDGADGGSWLPDEEAGDVDTGEVLYKGGRPGASIKREIQNGKVKVYAKGGGASGAVYGHDGAPGEDGQYYSGSTFTGGHGGDAPDPDELPDVATLSSGGAGGNGGAGGGSGGNAYRSDSGGEMAEAGTAGTGSDGSAGKPGGCGFGMIMYKQ